jgi:hypothetical protein
MTEQQQHLTQVLNQQKTLATEIQDLNNTLAIKKEQFLKLQGIVEYLTGNGVTLENTTQNMEETEE